MINQAGKQAFTLIEILVAIVIIALLIIYLAPRLINPKERAQDAAAAEAAHTIYTDYVLDQIPKYDLAHRFGANYDNNYLNGKLENLLENIPYDNRYGYKNPCSGSKVILNWTSVPSSLAQPAVFITNNPIYSYKNPGARSTPVTLLRGTVVIYTANSDPRVDVYYYTAKGYPSKLYRGNR